MSGFGFHTPICGFCADKHCIWVVSECGTDLFRQHPRRKFDLFISNTVDSLTSQIIPFQVYSHLCLISVAASRISSFLIKDIHIILSYGF